ncbi:MAG: SapC family protein [Sphingobium sp.]|nr:SapC family protein [Sphingobium sp.]
MTTDSKMLPADGGLVPLNADQHGGWRVVAGGMAHAGDVPFAPILVGEFAAAARVYPIVFSASDPSPIAVMGLERRNLFVDNGQWACEVALPSLSEPSGDDRRGDIYVPAHILRHPFALLRTPDERHVLAIDPKSPLLHQDGDEGVPLFEDGKPTAVVAAALKFCDVFRVQADATIALVRALEARDLLIERQANVTLVTGRSLGLTGFRIVDEARFAKLDGPTVVEWHAKGWLAPIHFHLASLDRLHALARRQARVDTVVKDAAVQTEGTTLELELETASA